MNKYEFRVTLTKDDEKTGYKKDDVLYPKGFFCRKKTIVLIGNTPNDFPVRMVFPIDSVDLKVKLQEKNND